MKRLLIFVVIVLIVVLAVPVVNLAWHPHAATALTTSEANPDFVPVAKVLEDNCSSCHVKDAKLPFYASLPVVKGLVAQDVSEGIRFLDLVNALNPQGSPEASEVALAKLENVVAEGTMPPLRFKALHWNMSLNSQERSTLLNWIAALRTEYFGTPTAAADFKAEVIQPIPDSVEANPAKVELGRQLYHDVRLSGDNTLSCASCHALDKGGTDQAPVSTGINGQKGPINSPTTFNSGFQFVQFWDGRAADLKEQAAGPVHNPLEMGSNWDQVLPKLQEDADFVQAFTAVYPEGLSGDAITDAIAEFERTLITPNSPFDKYLKGDQQAIGAKAHKGYEIFKEAGCANCHVGKAMGGQSFERMGRYREYFQNPKDPDFGRYNVTKAEADKFHFKVPLLRNVEVTFPYFHDASTSDLAEAVRVMADHQSRRKLSDMEVDQIVSFLHTLTGEYQGQSLKPAA
ncbi:MAG: heme-binding domain-containing protein [Candidatus Hydrogenedentes bacterium]|nr:heme-binding domain-containing protein [Candidatus Hydrogenedentota bacterium]